MRHTVIIPSRNEALILPSTLDVLVNSFEELNVHVVLNGNTDNTRYEIAEGMYKRRFDKRSSSFEVHELYGGNLSKARNYGFERATTPLVTFLDADTYPCINYFAFVNHLKENTDTFTEYEGIYPRLMSITGERKFSYWLYHLFCKSPLPTCTGGCLTVNREGFPNFAERIKFHGEEHELTKRGRFKYLPNLGAYTSPRRMNGVGYLSPYIKSYVREVILNEHE